MLAPESAIVITTYRSTDRLALFQKRWDAIGAPLPLTVHMGVIPASPVDGCFTSHRDGLLTATGPVLMLEDDALFAPEFTLDLAYPDDAELFYLGGEHRLPPLEEVSPGIVRVARIRRNHAYIVYDPHGVAAALGEPKGHIDTALTALRLRTYAVKPFTVGQIKGPSLINIKPRATDEFWNTDVIAR